MAKIYRYWTGSTGPKYYRPISNEGPFRVEELDTADIGEGGRGSTFDPGRVRGVTTDRISVERGLVGSENLVSSEIIGAIDAHFYSRMIGFTSL
jgi:hypothetical protein